jgi:hypothetical protein
MPLFDPEGSNLQALSQNVTHNPSHRTADIPSINCIQAFTASSRREK